VFRGDVREGLELLVGQVDLGGVEVVLEVLDARGPGDRQDHRRAPQQPRQRQLRRARADLARDLVERTIGARL
jgi:hypothetical protein